jgi:hypothetical protein
MRPIDDPTRIPERFDDPDEQGSRRCRSCAGKIDGPDQYLLQHIRWHLQVG